MSTYNSTSLTHYCATVCKLFGVEAPANAAEPIDWVCTALADICKEGFDRILIQNPDAVGMWLYEKYPDAFTPVLKHTHLTIPFQTVMPSYTPVCFGTMYTGAEPAVHGIQKYEKPIIRIDTFFDAMIRAGKKVALVASPVCSMSNIFLERDFDIYHAKTEAEAVAQAENLILEDKYDVLIVYTPDYDTKDHKYGPEAKESLAALYRQGEIFDHLMSTVKRNWKQHNTLISFSPDHGVHAVPEGTLNSKGKPVLGHHGTDSPLDLNILHYMGAVLRSKEDA